MNLQQLLGEMYPKENLPSLEIDSISVDTRTVKSNALFIMIAGENFDPHDLSEELEAKVAFFITEKPIKTNKNYLIDDDIKNKLGQIYARFYHHPEKAMQHLGITGTNGKTSIGYILQHLLNHKVTSYIGTLGVQINRENINLSVSTPTTPQAPELFNILDYFRSKAVEINIMEVSSHALAQNRTQEILFKYAIFTNLTVDHLDYHVTMENYFKSKKILFDNLSSDAFAITNSDDTYGVKIVSNTKAQVIRYGFSKQADFQITAYRLTKLGIAFTLIDTRKKLSYDFETEMIGKFNAYNLAAAIIIGLLENLPYDELFMAVKQLKGIPGRMEKVPSTRRNIFVDYAHTEDGLEHVLRSLHDIRQEGSRIITVFGCGGDRDKSKRQEMGRVAEKYSDVTIVTSDNPRTEDPQAIIDDICKGMQRLVYTFISRKQAIKKAIEISNEKDLILLAGKGHENYQIIGTEKLEFNDKAISLAYLT